MLTENVATGECYTNEWTFEYYNICLCPSANNTSMRGNFWNKLDPHWHKQITIDIIL